MNNLEIDEYGNVLNYKECERRAAQYIRRKPDSGIWGRKQIIFAYLNKLDSMPELKYFGVPTLLPLKVNNKLIPDIEKTFCNMECISPLFMKCFVKINTLQIAYRITF